LVLTTGEGRGESGEQQRRLRQRTGEEEATFGNRDQVAVLQSLA
jgi:hypothetical protein